MKLFDWIPRTFTRFKDWVERTHANWWALAAIIVTILLAVGAYFAQGGAPARPGDVRPSPAATPSPDTALSPEPSPTETASGQCDEEQWGIWSQMRSLIDTEIQTCVAYIKNPVDLHQTCRATQDGYEVVVKRQVSGVDNNETISFTATYRGHDLGDVDYSQVKLAPMTPVFAALCRDKRARDRASRRSFGP